MLALANLAFAVMLVAVLATGGRLVWTAQRTRRVPELAIGLAVLTGAVGGVGETLSVHMIGSPGADPETAFRVQALARMLYMVGSAALLLGLWRIFHPDRAWAGALAVGGSLASLALGIAWVAGGQHTHVSGPDARGLAFQLARAAPYVWGAWCSFRYHGRMLRRLELGLADPVIAHQFWLWGIASTAMVALVGVIVASHHLMGISPLRWTPGLLGLALAGLVAGVTIYTAFFPPARYRRWVAARA